MSQRKIGDLEAIGIWLIQAWLCMLLCCLGSRTPKGAPRPQTLEEIKGVPNREVSSG